VTVHHCLGYLEKGSRPDIIAYVVHQSARFSANPKKEHGDAVKWIGHYLKGTRDKDIYIHPKDLSFKVWDDADFLGNWCPEEADFDSDTSRSRTSYIMSYLGCPLMWKSQLQTEISLSTTESEYISLSQATRKIKPIMLLEVQEMQAEGFETGDTIPTVGCTLFQDNSGALTLANSPSMHPRSKHINFKYHHFRNEMANKTINIGYVPSEDQLADMLTKQSEEALFVKHQKTIMGW